MLYYVHGEFSRYRKRRLIADDFYAWQLGPVIPEIYTEYSIFSSSVIPVQKQAQSFCQDDLDVINFALEKYAHESTWNLVELSHHQDPWKYNYGFFLISHIYIPSFSTDIFFKLQQIISQSSNSEVLDILGENLNVLGSRIDNLAAKNSEDANYKNTAFGYKKFSDHIKLEIGRYNFIKSHFSSKQSDKEIAPVSEKTSTEMTPKLTVLEKAVNDMRPTVTKAQKIAEQTEQQLSGLDEKLENNKISSITTLTIFSAVILAFSGGITFEAGIFNGMADSTPYRLVFTIGLTGFIIFNTIFALLYLVGKMAGKRISTKCKYLSLEGSKGAKRTCGDGYCTKGCSEVTVACKILHKYSYVFAINCVLIYTLYSDFFLWLGNGKVSNIIFVLSQVALVVVILVIVIVGLICKKMSFNRIKLHYKVSILQEILDPQEDNSIINNMSKLLAKAFGATVNKSMADKFLGTVQGKNGKEALQYLDGFINEHLIDNNRLAISVSKYENKVNKCKWERLK